VNYLDRVAGFGGIRAGNIEDPLSTLSAPAAWLLDSLGSRPSAAGVNVSPKTALLYGPALACQRVLAETVATVETVLVQKIGERETRREMQHSVSNIVSREFNTDLLAMNGFMNMQGHLCGWGNAFAEIEFDRGGYPVALHPLLPDRTYAERIGGKKVFRTVIGTEPVTLPANRVLHIPGWGYDGLSGYSPIRLATQAIGLGLAQEEYASRWFSGGSRPTGILTSDKPIPAPRALLIKERWESLHQGLSQAHRIAVLEDGLKFQAISVSPGDAQLLESRKWQIPEVCRAYRMAPHMIQHVEAGGAKANMEQQSLEFVMFTMMTWFVLWEQALTQALLSVKEIEQGYRVRFLVKSLLRGDFKTLSAGIAILRQWGVLTANDARDLLDLNSIGPEGDVTLVPLNMISAAFAATWKPSPPGAKDPSPAKPNPSPTANPKQAGPLLLPRHVQARYQDRMASIVQAAAERYIQIEIYHARRALKAQPSPEAFLAKMETLWTGTFPETIRLALTPGLTVLAEYAADAAWVDVGMGAEAPDLAGTIAHPAAIAACIAAAERHVEQSRAELGDAEPVAVIETLARWESSRSGEIATSETEALSAKVVAEVYRLPPGTPAAEPEEEEEILV
jgi:HK97 family phage portal protein